MHGRNSAPPVGARLPDSLYQQEYGTLLSVLPVILLFLAPQREFVAGLTAGAVKG
jgi:ABC-type maltose transport system permease subunit